MLPRERVQAAFNGQPVDFFPAICPTSVANMECMKIANSFAPQCHTEATSIAALAATSHTILGFDSVMPYFSGLIESEILGCKVSWNMHDSMPLITEKPLRSPHDLKTPKSITNQPLFRQLLGSIRILKKSIGKKVAIFGKVVGPWSLIYNLYGIENLLLDIILDPEPIHWLLDELVNLCVQSAIAQFDAGVDYMTWIDHVSADLISTKQYEEFVLPIHKKAASKLKGKTVVFRTLGNVLDRLDSFCKTGFTAVQIGSINDPVQALKIVDNRMVIVGGINTPVTLINNKAQAIKKEVYSNINAGIHLIAPEYAIPYKVSNSALISLVNSTHRYHT